MESLSAGWAEFWAGLWAAWWDLALPAPCPGCRRAGGCRGPMCDGCAAELAAVTPRSARPSPSPPGMPRCYAAGPYGGVLRELIAAYKERGRHGLARPLAERLADAVDAAADAAAAPLPTRQAAGTATAPLPTGDGAAGSVREAGAAGGQAGGAAMRPLVLIPAPATAQAIRRRRGDHMVRLARLAATRLRSRGRPAAVLTALRARPRPDSAGLSAAERAAAARAAMQVRHGATAALSRVHAETLSQHVGNQTRDTANSAVSGAALVVVVDDVVTTGATIAAACRVLSQAGAQVHAAAVLAATQRRSRRLA